MAPSGEAMGVADRVSDTEGAHHFEAEEDAGVDVVERKPTRHLSGMRMETN